MHRLLTGRENKKILGQFKCPLLKYSNESVGDHGKTSTSTSIQHIHFILVARKRFKISEDRLWKKRISCRLLLWKKANIQVTLG